MDSNAHSRCHIKRRNEKTDITIFINKGIVFEDDVLIGARCIILKGVTVGARSIIAAGSIVIKSIPSDCIAVGILVS